MKKTEKIAKTMVENGHTENDAYVSANQFVLMSDIENPTYQQIVDVLFPINVESVKSEFNLNQSEVEEALELDNYNEWISNDEMNVLLKYWMNKQKKSAMWDQSDYRKSSIDKVNRFRKSMKDMLTL